MSKENNRLIQYCKDNDFPVNKMDEDYFKAIEDTFGYQRYLLTYKIIELHREIIRPFKKIIIYMINKIN